MKTLRKGSILLGVMYADGGFSNNLFGSLITVETREGRFALVIDMASNFRVRNKSTNTFADAEELAGKRPLLSWIQIDEGQVIEDLTNIWEREGRPPMLMKLLLATHGMADYEVRPETTNSSLFLKVVRYVDV